MLERTVFGSEVRLHSVLTVWLMSCSTDALSRLCFAAPSSSNRRSVDTPSPTGSAGGLTGLEIILYRVITNGLLYSSPWLGGVAGWALSSSREDTVRVLITPAVLDHVVMETASVQLTSCISVDSCFWRQWSSDCTD